jgi:methionine synthase II (cobalamin-independent)
MLSELSAGTRLRDSTVDRAVRDAVFQSVADQVRAGIDIANDGEMGKINYRDYAAERFIGFSAERTPRNRTQYARNHQAQRSRALPTHFEKPSAAAG